MEDFRYQMTVDISGKTHSALISFLQKHGQSSHDISEFVEEAITWCMIEREMAYVHRVQRAAEAPVAVAEDEDRDAENNDFLAAQLVVEERADRAA